MRRVEVENGVEVGADGAKSMAAPVVTPELVAWLDEAAINFAMMGQPSPYPPATVGAPLLPYLAELYVRGGADGAQIATATADIGTGTYTILAQIGAEMLGLPLEKVTVKIGDSDLPPAPVEGGSWTAASVGSAVMEACDCIRKELLKRAGNVKNAPLDGAELADVTFIDGEIRMKADPSRGLSLSDVLRGANEPIVSELTSMPDWKTLRQFSHKTHSAVFAEVRLDEELGMLRVVRVVSAVAAGRILNTKTARSQIMGAVVGGIGMALHEETVIDHRFGRFINHNFAEYHVPVNADIHDIDVIFVDERETHLNALGVKGVGEIGIVGTAAAIANAVYHATGVRVRDLPITIDKILGLTPRS